MDSNDLERERGITILAKATSVAVEGHAHQHRRHARPRRFRRRGRAHPDRWSTARCCWSTPPKARCRRPSSCSRKALELGLQADRRDQQGRPPRRRARPRCSTRSSTCSSALDATDEQLDFPTLYASARQGWAADAPGGPHKDMEPLFDLILRHVPRARGRADGPFRMLVTTLEADPLPRPHPDRPHRVGRDQAEPAGQGAVARRHGDRADAASPRCWPSAASSASPLDDAEAGDIVAIAGLTNATVADTICDLDGRRAAAAQPIDPPTLAMTFPSTTRRSPAAKATRCTTRMIRDRLMREAEGNVAIRVPRRPRSRLPTRSPAAASCSSAC